MGCVIDDYTMCQIVSFFFTYCMNYVDCVYYTLIKIHDSITLDDDFITYLFIYT